MRPVQNALAIVATFFVAGSLLPWSPRLRLTCALAAMGLIVLLLVMRMRAHLGVRQRRENATSWSRIERIRADRERRLGRR
jgi:hypothetical protein